MWPVADRRPTTWLEFLETVQLHHPQFRFVRIPESFARFGTRLLRPGQLLRRAPTVITADSVSGWNLNLAVDPEVLWSDFDLAPRCPTIEEGIPAVLDDCVAARWLHPVQDHRGR